MNGKAPTAEEVREKEKTSRRNLDQGMEFRERRPRRRGGPRERWCWGDGLLESSRKIMGPLGPIIPLSRRLYRLVVDVRLPLVVTLARKEGPVVIMWRGGGRIKISRLATDSTPGWTTLARGSAPVPSRDERDAQHPVKLRTQLLEEEGFDLALSLTR